VLGAGRGGAADAGAVTAALAGAAGFTTGLTFLAAVFLGAAFFATTFFGALLRFADLALTPVFFAFFAAGLRAIDFLAVDLRAVILRAGFFALVVFEALPLAGFFFLEAVFAISVHSLNCHGDHGTHAFARILTLMNRVSQEVKMHDGARPLHRRGGSHISVATDPRPAFHHRSKPTSRRSHPSLSLQ